LIVIFWSFNCDLVEKDSHSVVIDGFSVEKGSHSVVIDGHSIVKNHNSMTINEAKQMTMNDNE